MVSVGGGHTVFFSEAWAGHINSRERGVVCGNEINALALRNGFHCVGVFHIMNGALVVKALVNIPRGYADYHSVGIALLNAVDDHIECSCEGLGIKAVKLSYGSVARNVVSSSLNENNICILGEHIRVSLAHRRSGIVI